MDAENWISSRPTMTVIKLPFVYAHLRALAAGSSMMN